MYKNNRIDQASGIDSQACTQRRYEITLADLPLSCPPRNKRVWDAHPRVYLPILEIETREIVCPYCGALYSLKNADQAPLTE